MPDAKSPGLVDVQRLKQPDTALEAGQAVMNGGGHLATGGNFYELRSWTPEQWKDARDRIEAQNRKDREQRTA